MDVTAQLLRVFLVEKQVRGLQSRLGGAEKFLGEQKSQLDQIETKTKSLEAALKANQVKLADAEGEMKRLDARMELLKKQMDTAQTNKEYKAFLTEVNTLKAERDKHETSALEFMGKCDESKKQIAELAKQRDEREQVKKVASDDRDKREAEIRDRLTELKAQRDQVATGVPSDALAVLSGLIRTKGDEAMAVVEIQDAKRHEFNCGSCMMSLPIDAVVRLMSTGMMTRCASCSAILYMDEEASKVMSSAGKKPAKKSKKSEKAAEEVENEAL